MCVEKRVEGKEGGKVVGSEGTSKLPQYPECPNKTDWTHIKQMTYRLMTNSLLGSFSSMKK